MLKWWGRFRSVNWALMSCFIDQLFFLISQIGEINWFLRGVTLGVNFEKQLKKTALLYQWRKSCKENLSRKQYHIIIFPQWFQALKKENPFFLFQNIRSTVTTLLKARLKNLIGSLLLLLESTLLPQWKLVDVKINGWLNWLPHHIKINKSCFRLIWS